jgi:hypothetical protein
LGYIRTCVEGRFLMIDFVFLLWVIRAYGQTPQDLGCIPSVDHLLFVRCILCHVGSMIVYSLTETLHFYTSLRVENISQGVFSFVKNNIRNHDLYLYHRLLRKTS